MCQWTGAVGLEMWFESVAVWKIFVAVCADDSYEPQVPNKLTVLR